MTTPTSKTTAPATCHRSTPPLGGGGTVNCWPTARRWAGRV
jgi:hypothetical protein